MWWSFTRKTNMKPEYQDWINENYPTPESARLKCVEATARMVEVFPELGRVRGHVMVVVDLRPHWWCVTATGDIVDPTAHQWGSIAFYQTLEDEEEPHGKCYHCGDLLFRSRGASSYFCENCQ